MTEGAVHGDHLGRHRLDRVDDRACLRHAHALHARADRHRLVHETGTRVEEFLSAILFFYPSAKNHYVCKKKIHNPFMSLKAASENYPSTRSCSSVSTSRRSPVPEFV